MADVINRDWQLVNQISDVLDNSSDNNILIPKKDLQTILDLAQKGLSAKYRYFDRTMEDLFPQAELDELSNDDFLFFFENVKTAFSKLSTAVNINSRRKRLEELFVPELSKCSLCGAPGCQAGCFYD